MYQNLDQFQAALSEATSGAVQQAKTNVNVKALVEAAKSGDQAKVQKIASGMSTRELQAAKRQLER
ncbi:hypothetical protein [Streptomyces acidiscabies]|uniref:hypothetical protein n=1 Tax=Streptomyces acidiscabies TaxID=42234 RepID=UPI000E67A2A9|nr:hypothetical protein [Streptomyces acidiscabies]MBP5942596.1 hypothetical protein [Streptomyces sp. LBUM 1476]